MTSNKADTYQEPEQRCERVLWSIPFLATTTECRNLYVECMETEEWMRWSVLSDRMNLGIFDACDATVAAGLARQLSMAYREMARMLVRKLDEMENDG